MMRTLDFGIIGLLLILAVAKQLFGRRGHFRTAAACAFSEAAIAVYFIWRGLDFLPMLPAGIILLILELRAGPRWLRKAQPL